MSFHSNLNISSKKYEYKRLKISNTSRCNFVASISIQSVQAFQGLNVKALYHFLLFTKFI